MKSPLTPKEIAAAKKATYFSGGQTWGKVKIGL